MTNETEIAEIVGLLEATPQILGRLFAGAPPSLLETPLDDDWSPKDLVAHLILAERLGAVERIRLVLERDRAELPAWDEREELERSGLRAHTPEALLGAFTELRAGNLPSLRELTRADLSRVGLHSEAGEVTIAHLLYQAAYHDATHLRQLFGMFESFFDSRRGPLGVY